MNKEEKQKDFKEIVELLIWSYKQGYMHAGAVLKDTIPDDKKLAGMFEKALAEKEK
jgi:hypothetical protein